MAINAHSVFTGSAVGYALVFAAYLTLHPPPQNILRNLCKLDVTIDKPSFTSMKCFQKSDNSIDSVRTRVWHFNTCREKCIHLFIGQKMYMFYKC